MINFFEDYDVLSILDSDMSSACYKVNNKRTSNIEVWKAVSCEALNTEEQEELIRRIDDRVTQVHPNLLKFYNCVVCKEIKTLYLVTECCKFGSLSNLIHNCIKNNEYFAEDFIWKLLYKISLSLKSVSEKLQCQISTSDIYVDDHFNVKYYNFDIENSVELQNTKEFNFGIVLHQLCTLQNELFDKTDIPNYYSDSLRHLHQFLLETDCKRSIDVILLHPVALKKSLQKDDKEFVIFKRAYYKCPIKLCNRNYNGNENESFLKACTQNIRNRELVLKARENKLNEKEYKLDKREKKIAILERMIKQKMVQADLYLKRSRGRKCTLRNIDKTLNYDKIDTSFSPDCGDSIIVPTSTKLDIDELLKCSRLSRTASERRVKFKGHSPLKEIHNTGVRDTLNYKRSICSDNRNQSRASAEPVDSLGTNSEKIRKTRFSLSSVFSRKLKMQDDLRYSEEIDNEVTRNKVGADTKPISWTEESKRNAFALLRIMNSEITNCPETLKETPL